MALSPEDIFDKETEEEKNNIKNVQAATEDFVANISEKLLTSYKKSSGAITATISFTDVRGCRAKEDKNRHWNFDWCFSRGVLDEVINEFILARWDTVEFVIKRTLIRKKINLKKCKFVFTKQVEKSDEQDLQGKKRQLEILQTRSKVLREQLEEVQPKIHTLEGEIQMLTESPNSRDPQLLPESL